MTGHSLRFERRQLDHRPSVKELAHHGGGVEYLSLASRQALQSCRQQCADHRHLRNATPPLGYATWRAWAEAEGHRGAPDPSDKCLILLASPQRQPAQYSRRLGLKG